MVGETAEREPSQRQPPWKAEDRCAGSHRCAAAGPL